MKRMVIKEYKMLEDYLDLKLLLWLVGLNCVVTIAILISIYCSDYAI